MTITSSTCYTAMYKFAVILEVYCKKFFSAFPSSYFSYSVIHIFTLFRCKQEICGSLIADRHIVEIPSIFYTFFDKKVYKVVGSNSLIVFACITDWCSEKKFMLFKQIHSMHCFFKMTCPTTSVILFSISFNTDRRHKVTYTKHFLTEILIYKSTVCKCAEHTVIMLFTKFYNIFGSYYIFIIIIFYGAFLPRLS